MTPDKLRTWRTEQCMTQKEAAEWVGVSRRLWIRFEQGHRPIPKWLKIIVFVYSLRHHPLPQGDGS